MVRYALALLVVALFGCAAETPSQDKKSSLPNIVIILADDMGIGDAGCYNAASKIKTPNIDKLATQGMRFNDMHSPSSVCTPTRYGLLTGRYCWRTPLKKSVLFAYDPLLIEPGRLTIASLLKQLGYITGVIGKWHLGLGNDAKADYFKPFKSGPKTVGFDYFFGIPGSLDMEPYVLIENDAPTVKPTAFIGPSLSQRRGGQGFWRGGPSAPGFKHEDVQPRLTEKAIEFVQKQKKNKPFFLYFPLSAPHEPWVPTKEFRGKSPLGPYGDFVQQMDADVGKLMKAIDDAGHADNTLFIFASDNGAHWLPEEIEFFKHKANMDWRGQKGDIWEGGHRVPFIARWPGQIKAGSTSDELVSLIDMPATIAALVDIKLPDGAAEDSFNFLPVLRDEKLQKPVRDFMIYHSYDGGFAIRQGPWVLSPELGSRGFTPPYDVKPVKGGPTGQLYNLNDDPGQAKNLWLNRPEEVNQLTKLLEGAKTAGRTRTP